MRKGVEKVGRGEKRRGEEEKRRGDKRQGMDTRKGWSEGGGLGGS